MADGIRATPYRSPFAGSANDLIGGLLGYMRDPRRTQQMQGLAGLLESTGIPKTVERLAYGEPLTNFQQANVPTLRPETAEALLTLLPVPSGASRAAKAADPFVQRYGPKLETAMEPMLASAYNRGGLTREMVEAMGTGVQSPLTVYHGSPAKFNKFDRTKIGSGEGAQAYGYGHYVAESPGVAKDYQRRLAKESQASDLNTKMKLVDVGGKPLTSFNVDINSDLIDAAKVGKTEFVNLAESKKARWEDLSQDQSYPFQDYAKQKVGAYTSLLDAAKKSDVDYTGTGMFYEIDLPDEQIAKMLDFDKPLAQQSKEIQALAKQYGLTDADHMGGDLIAAMDVKRATGAEAMRQAGVPGIRYLDQGSRGVGEGTSNFVVFPGNEGLLTIQKRNNEVIAPTSLLDYGMQHRPMTIEGGAAKLYDAGTAFGQDVYGKNALQYFGSGLSGEKTSLDILKKVRGNPDAEITIYRGVPEGVNSINKGDWVTLDQKMAEEYGNVISKKVKAKDITTWPDSLVEFGYYPD